MVMNQLRFITLRYGGAIASHLPRLDRLLDVHCLNSLDGQLKSATCLAVAEIDGLWVLAVAERLCKVDGVE